MSDWSSDVCSSDLYELDDSGKVEFSHNPFSMPQGGLEALESKAPLDILAYHLDIDAREALVQELNAYDGAVVLISHDPNLLELNAHRQIGSAVCTEKMCQYVYISVVAGST